MTWDVFAGFVLVSDMATDQCNINISCYFWLDVKVKKLEMLFFPLCSSLLEKIFLEGVNKKETNSGRKPIKKKKTKEVRESKLLLRIWQMK